MIVDQTHTPVGFLDAGVYWQELGGDHEITSGQIVVQLSDDANGRLNADAIRIERIGIAHVGNWSASVGPTIADGDMAAALQRSS